MASIPRKRFMVTINGPYVQIIPEFRKFGAVVSSRSRHECTLEFIILAERVPELLVLISKLKAKHISTIITFYEGRR